MVVVVFSNGYDTFSEVDFKRKFLVPKLSRQKHEWKEVEIIIKIGKHQQVNKQARESEGEKEREREGEKTK